LYCELFGGNFNGKTEKGSKCVQKNANYLSSNEILAYDLKVTLIDKSYFYVDMKYLIKLFEKLSLSIKLVPIIKIGTFDDIMNLNPKFITCVPKIYNFETNSNNFAEGYVIKPMNEMKFQDNSRFIFKYKNPEFSEINIKKDQIVSEKKLTIQQIYLEKIKLYVNENRFNNLITKYVDDWSNINITVDIESMLISKMIDNIKTDFIKDHENDTNFKIDYLCTIEKALVGIVTGFIKKIVHNKKHKKYNF